MHKACCLLWCCFLLMASLLAAQEFRATVTGHVADSSGAAMANLNIRITNAETNVNITAVTNAQGVYTLPFLSPGTYRLTAEAPGFKTFIRDQIKLSLGETAGVDIAMEVGDASQSVTVTAQTVSIETENADRGLVLDRLRVVELPLSARNPNALALLSTAVNFNGAPNFMRPFDGFTLSMNGGQNALNEWLIDGAPNTQTAGMGVAYTPPVDAVEEFKVQSSSYDAAFGKTGGGVISVTTKSGTNAFHGTGYEFMRRAPLDANSFQNNATGQPYAGHYLDQYGGSIGGPIILPKYNGRDKSFFFFNYEPYREGTPTPLTLSVPQPEMLTGDFSKLVDAQGRKITIYDPTTRVINADGSVTRMPFQNNTIPTNQLNPVMQKVMSFFPKPTTTAGPGQAYGNNDLFIAGGSANLDKDSFYNMVIRLDENLNEKNRLFFREASSDRTENRSANGVYGPGWNGPDPQKRINDAYVLDWVSTLSPTLVTDARVAYSRYVQTSSGVTVHNSPFDPTTLGFPQSLINQLPIKNQFGSYVFNGVPSVVNAGFMPLGQDIAGFTFNNNWDLALSVTKAIGHHTFRAGADLRRIYFNDRQPGTGLDLVFDPAWTQKTYNLADSLSGNTWASALLGLPASGGTTIAASGAYQDPYYAFYLQDDWKVTRKLTVNLGLRYDVWLGPTERYNRLARGFDPNGTNPVNASIDRTKFPNYPTVKGGLLFTSPGQTDFNYYSNTWQPRAGFAYQFSSKLVMRGGFGRYTINPSNDWLRLEGSTVRTDLVTSLDGGKTPLAGLITNPYPTGLIQPPGNTLGLGTFVGQNISFFNPDFKIPYVNQFSFGFEYELPLQSRLDIAYTGSRTYDLMVGCNSALSDRCTGLAGIGTGLSGGTPGLGAYNLPSQSVRKQCDPLEGGTPSFCDALLPNPFFGLPQFAGTSLGKSPTLSRYTLSQPFPEFGQITELGRNDGKIWYNALTAQYLMRAQKGLNLTFGYTWSKMITQSGYIDPIGGVLERSVSPIDRTHVIKISEVYQLPFGRGKSFLSSSSRFVDALVGGWEHNTIMSYQTGIPWLLPAGTLQVRSAKVDTNWHSGVVVGARPCVAQMADNGTITLSSFSSSVAGCSLDNYSFLRLPRYAPNVGPLQSSDIRLRGGAIFDMSVSKNIKFNERMSFQFRVEAFNAFNHFLNRTQQFNNTITSSSFGTLAPAASPISNTVPSRQIQLGMKFIF